MPRARFCLGPGAGQLCPGRRLIDPRAERCEDCRPIYARRDEGRRRAKPQRKVWDSAQWQRVRKLVLARDGYACRHCGRHRLELDDNERLSVHHVVPLAQGGSAFDPANLLSLCSRCHVADESA